jgi:hypothetical protein
MDDGFHHCDDEAVLGVRAARVSGWEAGVRLLMIAAPGGGRSRMA